MQDARVPRADGVGPQRLLRAVAGLLAVFWGLVFFGLIDLLAFLQGPEFHDTIVLSTGWGLLFLLLVAGPLVAISLGPSSLSAAATVAVAAVAVALVVVAILGAAPCYLFAAAGMAVTARLTTRPRGKQTTWRSTWHWSPLPAVVLSVAVLPLGYYAVVAARNTGTAIVTDDTVGLDHWPAQAALPIAVLLIATAAAGHPRGWRLLAWLVTACGLWFAAVCWLEPHLVASVGRAWSVALFAWSLVFVTVAHSSARDHNPRPAG